MTFDLTQNWDFLAFFVGVVLAALALEIWLRGSRYRASLSLPAWIVLLVILVSGWFAVQSATKGERNRIRTRILGFAPTYALVMQHFEHDKVSFQSPADDPAYLDLIDAQMRLLAVNPTINDIYTMRKLPTGETAFMVDSETDYDRNGKIEGEREGRTAIGEIFPIEEPELDRAFEGIPGFASTPVTDRWGTWVSAYYPIRTDAGELDGVLGIDLDAATWISAVRQVRLGGIGLLGTVAAMVLGAATIIALLRSHIAAQAVAQAELAHARDAAIAADRQKSEFLANMSHEIRTPMNGILGVTGLLLETELTPQQRADAVTIRTSADSLLGILNDILDFSKVEAGKLTFESVDFDVREAVEGVLDLLGERASAKQLEISNSIEAAVPRTLRGDPGRLRQVLLNLLGNALKFTEAGEVGLRVSSVREAAESAVLRFEVSDTGIGLSPEQQSHVFDAFVQGDSSTERKFGGTGLGLAISKQLVEHMGGEIGVFSEVGKGSTFWFTCELQRPGAPAADVLPPADTSLPRAQSPRSKNARVLIADDNSVNRMVAVRQLRQLGYQAVAVANGKEAIREATRIAYDAVLMDCQMPEMDGYEATRRLRELGFSIPVIALTAHAMQGARDRCLEAGMTDYLCKPVRMPELEKVLERAIPAEEVEDDASRAALLPPPISAEALELFRDATGDDADFAAELAGVFRRETAQLITEIYQAISTEKDVQLERAIHKLKGSCASFGAEALVETCERLEERISTGEGADLVVLARELRSERQRLLDAIEPERQVAASV